MGVDKDNLKLVKELIKYYQIPIMFFLKEFYEKL